MLHFGIFALIMISPMSDFFLFKFSYAHNYVLSVAIAVFFAIIHRVEIRKRKKIMMPIGFMLGFCFAISNELSPIAYIAILVVYVAYKIKRKELPLREITKRYSVQLIVFLGVIAGMIFFHLSPSVHDRANGAYGQIYDYVSMSNMAKSPVYTLSLIYRHFWYNMRYLWWLIPLIATTIGMTYVLDKKRLLIERETNDVLLWQVLLLTFSVLYMGGGSLIAVHDDMYVRFFAVMLIALLTIWLMLVKRMLPFFLKKDHAILGSVIFFNFIFIFMFLDMFVAFSNYNRSVKSSVDKIQLIDHDAPKIPKNIDPELLNMKPSFLFRWQQANPFSWYVKDKYYLKSGLNTELPK